MISDKIKKYLPDFSQYKSFPSWKQWKQLPKVLTKFDKFALLLFIIVLIGSAASLGAYYKYRHTVPQPAQGGTFTEGMTGQPRFINPVYVSSNDIDRSLVQLTFAGLMQYKDGKIIPDLAKSYNTEDGKVWTVTLKEDITWQDGEPITAEDVVFTVNVLQDSDYKSPQRVNWIGVNAKKVSTKKVKFELSTAYPQFLENLTLKIIPKHVWKNIQPADFSLSSYNLKPIGSGPYQIEDIDQEENRINSLTLVRNKNYHDQPYLDKIIFKFYKNKDQLIEAAEKEKVNGVSLSTSTQLESFESHNFSLPRYFAVFFNPENSELLSNKNIRRALNYATDRKELVEKVLDGKGNPVYSPILPSIYGFKQPSQKYAFDLNKAKEILKNEGFEDNNENGLREKTKEQDFQFNQRLEGGMENASVEELQKCLVKEVDYSQENVTSYFGDKTKEAVTKFQEKYKEDVLQPHDLESGTGIVGQSTRKKLNQVCFETPKQPLSVQLTLVDQPEMNQVANLLKKQWKKAGVDLKINSVSLSKLKTDHIKSRNYESLLFGQSLGIKPDFYSFWHSSQDKDPGLNLAKYDSEEADKLLGEARKTLDNNKRADLYEDFQKLLLEEAPVVFLYNPKFTYQTSKIKGVEPSLIVNPAHRFSLVKDWYLKLKGVWR
ncbi:MAG: ABC transporter substrate-binding protein [Candidatus Paceibacterota bacterium]